MVKISRGRAAGLKFEIFAAELFKLGPCFSGYRVFISETIPERIKYDIFREIEKRRRSGFLILPEGTGY